MTADSRSTSIPVQIQWPCSAKYLYFLVLYLFVTRIMFTIVLAAFSSIAALFTLISLIGAATTKDVLKYLYWTKVHADNGDIYWGLFAMYADIDYYNNYYNPSGVYKYANSNCDSNTCDNCGIAGQVVTTFSVITLLAAFAAVVMYSLRSSAAYNTTTFKIGSLVAVIVALVSNGITLIVWGGQCQANVYDAYDGTTVTVGPAYGLALGVVILCLIVVTIEIVFWCMTPRSDANNSSNLIAPLNPSAPYISEGFNASGVSSNPMMVAGALAGVHKPSGHCSFCGKKHAREFPSHPDETTRYCSVCGKRHIVEEGLKYCASCGAEIKF